MRGTIFFGGFCRVRAVRARRAARAAASAAAARPRAASAASAASWPQASRPRASAAATAPPGDQGSVFPRSVSTRFVVFFIEAMIDWLEVWSWLVVDSVDGTTVLHWSHDGLIVGLLLFDRGLGRWHYCSNERIGGLVCVSVDGTTVAPNELVDWSVSR